MSSTLLSKTKVGWKKDTHLSANTCSLKTSLIRSVPILQSLPKTSNSLNLATSPVTKESFPFFHVGSIRPRCQDTKLPSSISFCTLRIKFSKKTQLWVPQTPTLTSITISESSQSSLKMWITSAQCSQSRPWETPLARTRVALVWTWTQSSTDSAVISGANMLSSPEWISNGQKRYQVSLGFVDQRLRLKSEWACFLRAKTKINFYKFNNCVLIINYYC